MTSLSKLSVSLYLIRARDGEEKLKSPSADGSYNSADAISDNGPDTVQQVS